MFGYSVALQGVGNENAVINAITAGATSAYYDRLRAAYAYASSGGAVLLADRLKGAMGSWEDIEKRWLISLDWGHTEPEALEFLASLPGSQVRIPNASYVLASNLTPKVCFHPKTLLLDQSRRPDQPPATLAIGSANLTVSGLRYGHEHVAVATWIRGALSSAARLELGAMQEQANRIDAVWAGSRRVDRRLISEYRDLRSRVRMRPRRGRDGNEDASERVRMLERTMHLTFDRVAALQAAGNLWVQIRYVVANRGAGVPGNQIDLAAGTRAFFGLDAGRRPTNTKLGTVRITYKGRAFDRNMRFGNNSMDKLDLPIPVVEGPPSYENEVLRFERLTDGAYELRLGSGTEAARWKRASEEAATAYRMTSGREWGVFG